jgi:hypothetical protein
LTILRWSWCLPGWAEVHRRLVVADLRVEIVLLRSLVGGGVGWVRGEPDRAVAAVLPTRALLGSCHWQCQWLGLAAQDEYRTVPSGRLLYLSGEDSKKAYPSGWGEEVVDAGHSEQALTVALWKKWPGCRLRVGASASEASTTQALGSHHSLN